jgi:hypothetical protein
MFRSHATANRGDARLGTTQNFRQHQLNGSIVKYSPKSSAKRCGKACRSVSWRPVKTEKATSGCHRSQFSESLSPSPPVCARKFFIGGTYIHEILTSTSCQVAMLKDVLAKENMGKKNTAITLSPPGVVCRRLGRRRYRKVKIIRKKSLKCTFVCIQSGTCRIRFSMNLVSLSTNMALASVIFSLHLHTNWKWL